MVVEVVVAGQQQPQRLRTRPARESRCVCKRPCVRWPGLFARCCLAFVAGHVAKACCFVGVDWPWSASCCCVYTVLAAPSCLLLLLMLLLLLLLMLLLLLLMMMMLLLLLLCC